VKASKAASKEERLLRRWAFNPREFTQEAIITPYNKAKGTNYKMTLQQEEATEAVRKIVTAKIKLHKKQSLSIEEVDNAKKIGVSIMSGKGVGKDAWCSWMVIWFLSCFPYPKVPCTSVSADQLSKVLWSEISKWLTTSLVNDWFVLQNDKLYFKHIEGAGKRWFAFPKTANPKSSVEEQVETLAGLHEKYLMVVVDEGAGVPDAVFDPLEGTLTGICNFILLIFNPTRTKGYALDSQYKNKDRWITLRWSAEDSEMVDKTIIERTAETYGKDSNPYRIRVLGLPPVTDEETLIHWEWIEESIERDIIPLDSDPVIKSVDCGAGRDKSVICTRKGGKIYPFKRKVTKDSMELVHWINADIENDSADLVFIDVIGIGWGVYGRLKEINKRASIWPIDARSNPINDKFLNKRAEMFWNLREIFANKLISIPDDPELKDELGCLKWITENKKERLISKKILRKELGHSTDTVDPLAQSYAMKDFLNRNLAKKSKGLKRLAVSGAASNSWMGI